MKSRLKGIIRRILEVAHHPALVAARNNQLLSEATLEMLASLRIDQQSKDPALRFQDTEFRVSSQWGQDGLIQYLLRHVPIENKCFVEFGVGDYTEANTRFLLTHDNWSGLIMDGGAEGIRRAQRDSVYWRHDLTAYCEFITCDNINDLIGRRFRGDIGLLNIDLDGNDYWIWQAINVINPRIVVCEYNSLFGAKKAVTVPYDPAFSRTTAHFSNLYFGASLPAMCDLAERKGYVFVGCTSTGGDAFFVRNDVAANVAAVSVEEGYVLSKFREGRDQQGHLTFLDQKDRRSPMADMDVFDVRENRLIKVASL